MSSIPTLFLEFRTKNGLTFRGVEERCGKIISASSWHEIEKGMWIPGVKVLTRFCAATGEILSEYLVARERSKLLWKIVRENEES